MSILNIAQIAQQDHSALYMWLDQFMNMNLVTTFAKGTLTTLELTMISMVVGTVLALFVALGRIAKNKISNAVTWVYVWIFRGTPLILQIMIVYVTLPTIYRSITGEVWRINPFFAAIIALTLNTGAYLAEIFRGGILSIDKGQLEASKALGMNYTQAMGKVIIPQSISRVIPSYSNEFIMILKDTSLVSAIGLSELYREANRLASGTGNWQLLFIAAGIYLVLTTISTFIFSKIEKRTSRYL